MGAHPDDYKRQAPYHSYIHVDEYESPKELAEYLEKLDKDTDLYNSYFQWKGTGTFINTFFWYAHPVASRAPPLNPNVPRLAQYHRCNQLRCNSEYCTVLIVVHTCTSFCVLVCIGTRAGVGSAWWRTCTTTRTRSSCSSSHNVTLEAKCRTAGSRRRRTRVPRVSRTWTAGGAATTCALATVGVTCAATAPSSPPTSATRRTLLQFKRADQLST